MITGILTMSAELLAGAGPSAPAGRMIYQSCYGEIDYGYTAWFNFFFQLSYLKGFPIGLEPYFRISHTDHNQRFSETTYMGMPIGSKINESVVSYELGASRGVFNWSKIYLVAGAAITGNFGHLEWESYGSEAALKDTVINRATPGLLGLARLEFRENRREYLSDRTVTLVIGSSGRVNYMWLSQDDWPFQKWFATLDIYVGVRW
ncbi:MAG: hypothetical protein ABIM74_03980 [candidate division WOR-3 bacterium]